ncbi:hypothetical protein PRZ48_012425 [Zasmidium cellare]|uniref:Aminoglycoside phosphotransferase domain-containing protein n=1 Tax=Zasmidium cellare TaxID=395010 RepID=A0ABR0E4T9_ZASCE|nr:hypothetical protein PRZ48_012425 [Zasmidium cellare]
MAEGGFNRVFELTMRDGLQVLARLPYPSTQPKALATTSEVATMDLLRSHGLPTPVVYGYSTSANNAVGAEYILMEKIRGQCLGDIWYDLVSEQKVKIMDAVMDQEVKLFEIAFPGYGSVYYDKDLPKHMERIRFPNKGGEFCLGPDASLGHWFGTRSQLDIPRGLAANPIEVLQQGAKKELAWLRAYGRRRYPFDTVYREMFNYEKVDPRDHISSLQTFLQVSQDLVPQETWLHKPVLRHPDLNLNNILIDENHKVVSIIDWQHASVLPLFLNCGVPKAFMTYDPLRHISEDSERASEPRRQHEDESVCDTYLCKAEAKLKSHYDALNYELKHRVQAIWEDSKAPWEGNSIPLQAGLISLAERWPEIATTKTSACPIRFSQKETEAIIERKAQQVDLDTQMNLIRAEIGIASDGWVSHERYDQAVARAAEIKEEALGRTEDDLEREMTEKHWPFDDRDEEE